MKQKKKKILLIIHQQLICSADAPVIMSVKQNMYHRKPQTETLTLKKQQSVHLNSGAQPKFQQEEFTLTEFSC